MHRAKTSCDFYGDELQDAAPVELPFTTLSGRRTPTGLSRPLSPSWAPGGGRHLHRPRSRAPPLACAYAGDTGRAGLWGGQVAVTETGDDPFKSAMDPINRQYYYRMWRQNPPRPLRPVYREGRLGGPWRHIKACVNSVGSHFVFVDGNVKSEENFFYPPETTWEPPVSLSIAPRIIPRRVSARTLPMSRGGRDSVFSERARSGFKYWPEEQKPIDYDTHLDEW